MTSVRSKLLRVAGPLLAVTLLILALRGMKWAEAAASLRSAHLWYLLAGLGPSIAGLWFRAMRWRVLLGAEKTLPRATVLWATGIGYFGNFVLPARAGEFLRSGAIHLKTGLPLAFVLATALTERLIDAAVRLLSRSGSGLVSIDAAKLTDRDFAYRWLTSAAPRFRDQKGAEGSDIHAEAEDLILVSIGKLVADGVIENDRLYLPSTVIPEYPADIATRMQSFTEWVNDFRPRFLATETSVFSRHGYAGTLAAIVDVFVVPPGELAPRWVTVCVDWKSGKGIYEEVGLQLAAYARADFIGLPDGTALPLPKCEFAAVLHLTPKGYRFKWVDVTDPVYEVFLNVCQVGKFRLPTPEYPKGIASTVIGADILPVEEAI